MTLTKVHLVNRVYERCGLAKKEAQEVVELFFNEMKALFKEGKSLKVSGFGNFNVKYKRSRRGRNPQTGETMMISERRVLTFNVSQVFKELLKTAHTDVERRVQEALDESGHEHDSGEEDSGERA